MDSGKRDSCPFIARLDKAPEWRIHLHRFTNYPTKANTMTKLVGASRPPLLLKRLLRHRQHTPCERNMFVRGSPRRETPSSTWLHLPVFLIHYPPWVWVLVGHIPADQVTHLFFVLRRCSISWCY